MACASAWGSWTGNDCTRAPEGPFDWTEASLQEIRASCPNACGLCKSISTRGPLMNRRRALRAKYTSGESKQRTGREERGQVSVLEPAALQP